MNQTTLESNRWQNPYPLLVALLTMLAVLTQVSTARSNAQPAGRLKTAIFVENRAGAGLNDKVPVLEDLLGSRVTDQGFSVISREVAVNALKTYTAVDIAVSSGKATSVKVAAPGEKTAAAAEAVRVEVAEAAASPTVTKLDQLLSDNTSALRLAQNLGADYLLAASITSLGMEKKTFEDGGVKTVNLIHTLRASYKVLETVQGGSLVGGTVKKSKTIRFTENSQTENSDIVNELLEEAAAEIADSLGQKKTLVSAPPPGRGLVEITVSCGMQDLAQLPVSVPDVRVAEDGTLAVTTNRLAIQILDATVEINGTAVGSAPGKFKVPPGLNKMKISREGFKDWERTANFSEGQKFNVALQMSEAGYARWKDNTAFLLAIESGKKLTDGLREMMGGFAQTLRQSGYRVDTKSDVKANIETKGKSLFDGASLKIFGD